MKVRGKSVVLTGAASGIGLSLLELLVQRGARVLAVDKQDFDDKIASVTYMKEDVSTENGVDNIFRRAEEVLGGIDIFIANAGFGYYEGVEEASWDKTNLIFKTCVNSPIYSFHKLKKIKKDKPFQFVVTASGLSYMPLPGFGLYSASKHALKGFFEAAIYELPKNQIVTMIYPVATKTPFFKGNARIPSPTQSVETVVKHYIKGIEKDKSHIYTSKSFYLVRHLPILQTLVQKLESKKFSEWRRKYE